MPSTHKPIAFRCSDEYRQDLETLRAAIDAPNLSVVLERAVESLARKHKITLRQRVAETWSRLPRE